MPQGPLHQVEPKFDPRGPGFQSAGTLLRAINKPVSFRLLKHFDPYLWRHQNRAAYLVALWTNDELHSVHRIA